MKIKKIKVIAILTIIAICICMAASFISKNIKKIYNQASYSQIKSYIYDTINITTDQIVIDSKNNALLTLSRDDKGLVSSLQIDADQINILSNLVAVECQADLKKHPQSLILHVGAFTGSTLLAHKGKTINIPMQVDYTVKSDFKTFTEKIGINVVRYALYLVVTTNAEIVLPTNQQNAEFITYIQITETVFSTAIPDTFVASEEGLNYLDLIP